MVREIISETFIVERDMLNMRNLACVLPVGLLLLPNLVIADELNAGDTAWMITATVLVLFMTIPGLSLFYAGMVRSKNVLSVLMQCFAITGLMSILWALYLYSLAFSDGGSVNAFVGGLDKALRGNRGCMLAFPVCDGPDDLRYPRPS